MVLYKVLNVCNDDFDPELIEKMRLLYVGGYDIMDNASMFMTKLTIESNNSFKERLKCAAYMPYLSQFIDQSSSALFSDDLVLKQAADAADTDSLGDETENGDFFKVFAANCNLMGDSLHSIMKDTQTEALYSTCAYIGVDSEAPTDGSIPLNRIEEEAMGLSRPYLYDIDPLTIVDWKCNLANQKFEWVKIKNCLLIHTDPLAPAMKQIEFKIWTMKNGLAHWDKYVSKVIELDKEIRPNDDIPLVDFGDTDFKEIPIFRYKIPDGLHMGNKLGPLCEEYFQRRSFLVSNMNKTCIAIPVAQLGPEISAPGVAMPSEAQQNPNRADDFRNTLSDAGYIVIGAEDDVKIVEATGASHELVDKQLIDLREQMHQVIHQMASSVNNNKQTTGRSGASKQEDRHSEEILLTAYGRAMKDFVRELCTCITNFLGGSEIIDPHGLSTFVEEDRQTVILEMQIVAGKQEILSLLPSPTFQKKYLTRLAIAMAGTLTQEEEAQIQEEIESGVDKGPPNMVPEHITEPPEPPKDNKLGS